MNFWKQLFGGNMNHIDLKTVIAAGVGVASSADATADSDYSQPLGAEDLLRELSEGPKWSTDHAFIEVLTNLTQAPPRLCWAAFLIERCELWTFALSGDLVGTAISPVFAEEEPDLLFYTCYRPYLGRSVFGRAGGRQVSTHQTALLHRVIAYAISLSKTTQVAADRIALCKRENPRVFPYIERTLARIDYYLTNDTQR